MMAQQPVLCLLTDFGLYDHYVSDMKGDLLSAAPQAQIIDITHAIPSQDIRTGAYQLLASYKHQPAGAFFICVVDPGARSERKILYAEAGGWRFIAPDNGLLSWVFEQIKPQTIIHMNGDTVELAAKILSGAKPESLGESTTSFVKAPFPFVMKHGSMWQGQVLAVDGFGNLITNFRSSEVSPLAATSKMWVEFEKTTATIRGLTKNYAGVEAGKPLALEGSSGFIEISVNQGNAATQLGLNVGDRVSIHFRS